MRKNMGCGTFLLSWLVSSLLLGVFFHVINKTGQSAGTVLLASIATGFLIGFAIFAFKMVRMTSKASKMGRMQRKKDRREGITRYRGIIHAGGLEAPENCEAYAVLSQTALTVVCGGNELVLAISKVRNVECQLDISERQYLKNSYTRGVAVPKIKSKREVKSCAVISYEGIQGHKTFMLKDEFPNIKTCAKLADTLKPMIDSQRNRIEL